MSVRFAIGDFVVPRPEWLGSPNKVPSGRVRALSPKGSIEALYVGEERRAFATYVFLPDPDKPAKAVGEML